MRQLQTEVTWQDSGLPGCYAWLRTIRGNVKSKTWSPWPLKTKVESPFETLGINNPGRVRLKCDGTRAETGFRLSAKRMSPFKSAGASVQSTTGSRGVRISGSNTLRSEVVWRVLAIHSIRQFPLHFPPVRRRVPSRLNWIQLNNKVALYSQHQPCENLKYRRCGKPVKI
jgi:hypothetical protein